ncbi:MAG: hypothetical protein HY370_02630 [Proteobacteria bacterium]|nr:hypothetical protein [Pseudomonadota bacterium]
MRQKKKTKDGFVNNDFVRAVLGEQDPDTVDVVMGLLDEGFRVQNTYTAALLINPKTHEAAAVTIFPERGVASTVQRGGINDSLPEKQTVSQYLGKRKPRL